MSRFWPFSRSLVYPLTAVLVALAVVPLALLGWGFVRTNQEQISTLEKQYLTRQAVGLARDIELFFVDTQGRLETVAQVLRPGSGDDVDVAAAAPLLSGVAERNGRLLIMRLLDVKGMGPFVQSRTLPSGVEAAIEKRLNDAFREGLSGKAVYESPIRFGGVHPMGLVSIPVTDSSGAVKAVLQGVVSLQWIASRLSEEHTAGVSADVVASDGTVLFSSDPAREGRLAVDHPLVAQFMRAPVRLTQRYHDPLRPDGSADVVGSLCPVGEAGWAVVTERDVNVAFAAVRNMAERSLLLVVVTAIAAMVAGGLLARRITRPLRHLAEVTSAVARGEYSRRVPATSKNELGQLAGNFNSMATAVERTVESLRHALRENQELLVDSIRALAAAIDAKNPYTRGHSERVSQYSVAIGKHIGLRQGEIRRLEIAALLHDVGKIGIEDGILLKPGVLTESEFATMRTHTLKGAAIVSPIKRLHEMLPGIRSHHENWNGGGYPDGLVGEEIPFMARIIAAADAFDAMTTHRPYQRAMRLESVLARIRELSGSRLDPRVVDALFAAIEAGDLVPLGSAEVA